MNNNNASKSRTGNRSDDGPCETSSSSRNQKSTKRAPKFQVYVPPHVRQFQTAACKTPSERGSRIASASGGHSLSSEAVDDSLEDEQFSSLYRKLVGENSSRETWTEHPAPRRDRRSKMQRVGPPKRADCKPADDIEGLSLKVQSDLSLSSGNVDVETSGISKESKDRKLTASAYLKKLEKLRKAMLKPVDLDTFRSILGNLDLRREMEVLKRLNAKKHSVMHHTETLISCILHNPPQLNLHVYIPDLLKAGADHDGNMADNSGYAYLHLCVMHNRIEELKILLEHGAIVDVNTREGRTPLFLAVLRARLECFTILIDYGARVNVKDLMNFTPLHMAAKLFLRASDNRDVIMDTLLSQGATLNTLGCSFNHTPLECALCEMEYPCGPVDEVHLRSELRKLSHLIVHGARAPRAAALIKLSEISCQLVGHGRTIVKEFWLLLYRSGIRFPADIQHRILAMFLDAEDKDVDFMEYITRGAFTVGRLQDLVRLSVREHLLICTNDRSIMRRVERLPLPQPLKRFLLMKE